jgi:hypothetical protein
MWPAAAAHALVVLEGALFVRAARSEPNMFLMVPDDAAIACTGALLLLGPLALAIALTVWWFMAEVRAPQFTSRRGLLTAGAAVIAALLLVIALQSRDPEVRNGAMVCRERVGGW